MTDLLAGLFGSTARVRVLRLFCFNEDATFTAAQVAQRTQCSPQHVRRELRMLQRIGMITSKSVRGARHKVYQTQKDFPLLDDITTLLSRATVTTECATLKRVSTIGEVHLALASGIFLNYTKARADLFIVANAVSRARLQRFITALEAEVGREVRYVLMNMEEYKYRMNMTDRFLRDFLHAPYDEVVNTIPHFKRALRSLARRS